MTAAPTDDQFFQSAFEGTLDALLLSDDNGIHIDVNDAACDLFGCDAEDLIGASLAEFLPSNVAFGPMWASFIDAAESRWTLDLHRPDGEIRAVECVANADIQPGIHLFALRDVSEREPTRTELSDKSKVLTKVFETSPVGILVVNGEGVVLEANRWAKSVLDLASDDDLRMADDETLRGIATKGGAMLPVAEGPVSKVFETGASVLDFEHGVERADGTRVWLSVNTAPIYATDGTVDRVIVVLSDITDRQAYHRMLEQQNRRLEEYSATVSHDLRTPLSVASGWLAVAIEDDQTEPLAKVDEALTRMDELITDLRELARHGQTVNEMAETDLEALAWDVWPDLETASATLEIGAGIGTIRSEENRLRQLFENLLRNAIEHAGPDVTVRVGPLEGGFYVQDDGAGISEAKRESVFEFGYSTTKRGTGIGLAIVKAVADAHGWHVDLTDTDPHGARFEFRTGWHPDRGRGQAG